MHSWLYVASYQPLYKVFILPTFEGKSSAPTPIAKIIPGMIGHQTPKYNPIIAEIK